MYIKEYKIPHVKDILNNQSLNLGLFFIPEVERGRYTFADLQLVKTRGQLLSTFPVSIFELRI